MNKEQKLKAEKTVKVLLGHFNAGDAVKVQEDCGGVFKQGDITYVVVPSYDENYVWVEIPGEAHKHNYPIKKSKVKLV